MNVERVLHTIGIVAGVIFLLSCGSGRPVIEVVNTGWPDGTVLIAVGDGDVHGRARLYGDHTRITLDTEGVYRVHAGDLMYLSASTEQFTVREGVNRIELPIPIRRKRFHGRMRGFTVPLASQEPIPDDIRDAAEQGLVTSITLLSDSAGTYADEVHQRMCELLVYEVVSERKATKDIASELDILAADGADGIVCSFAKTMTDTDTQHAAREYARAAHEIGMTMAITVFADSSYTGNWYRYDAPDTEQPDEVRIAVPPVASMETIRLVADILTNDTAIAHTTVQFNASPIATAIETGDAVTVQPGVLDSLMTVSGGGVMRIRDGSGRFGYGGVSYSFDDAESIIEKIRLIKAFAGDVDFGVYIWDDATGVKFDSNDMVSIAELLK